MADSSEGVAVADKPEGPYGLEPDEFFLTAMLIEFFLH